MNEFGLDLESTKNKAKCVLRDYRNFEEVAETDYVSNVTATYSFEPKSYTGTIGTPIQNHLERKLLAEQIVQEINAAINKITEAEYRAIIIKKYCDKEYAGNDGVAIDLKMTQATFYRKLDKALIRFATHFKNGKLLVYSGGDCIENHIKKLLE